MRPWHTRTVRETRQHELRVVDRDLARDENCHPPGSALSAREPSLRRTRIAEDGLVSEDASADNTALIDALRNGGDPLNVFGDFPTERDPRHAQAYGPRWDAPLGLWTDKAVQQGLNRRQIDDVQVS